MGGTVQPDSILHGKLAFAMGAARRRREQFLAQHPLCCFCGGGVATTTEDHLPPRTFFFERRWPTGYAFPACDACNNSSSEDDQIAALVMFMRVGRPHRTPERDAEVAKRIDDFVRRYPQIARDMKMTTNERRHAARVMNMKPGPGRTHNDLPILQVTQRQRDAVERVFVKLAKALHYHHTCVIPPANAFAAVSWWTYADFLAKTVPDEFLKFTGMVSPDLKSQHVPVNDQFAYRFSATPDGQLSFATTAFHASVVAAIGVSCDPEVGRRLQAGQPPFEIGPEPAET